MIEIECILSNFTDNTRYDLIESHLHLGSSIHIFKLADSLFCFHDPDDDDKSCSDTIGFFELDFDARCTQ